MSVSPTHSHRLADLALGLLRLLPPEWSHRLTLSGLNWTRQLGLLRLLASPPPHSSVRLMGLDFRNRIGVAAGLDKEGVCIDALSELGFGFVEIGTVTPAPCAGNSGRRVRRLRRQRALVNRLGFPSSGLARLRRRLEARRSPAQSVLGINLGKQPAHSLAEAAGDYRLAMRELWALCDYLTINLSSPNSPGLRQLQEPEQLRRLLEELADEREALATRHGCQRPVLIKLSPDMDERQAEQVAATLAQLPIEGVILSNTTVAHANPEWGGLSGPPLAAASRLALERFHAHLPKRVLRISCGGIDSGDEALQRLRQGADLIQLYTGLVYSGIGLLTELGEALASADKL